MKYLYLRNKKQLATGRGGLALGYEVLTEITNPNGTVDVAVVTAKCSEHDSFHKKFARQVLDARMEIGLAGKGDRKFSFEFLNLKKDQSLAKQLKDKFNATHSL